LRHIYRSGTSTIEDLPNRPRILPAAIFFQDQTYLSLYSAESDACSVWSELYDPKNLFLRENPKFARGVVPAGKFTLLGLVRFYGRSLRCSIFSNALIEVIVKLWDCLGGRPQGTW
jgi:hypothetical protein